MRNKMKIILENKMRDIPKTCFNCCNYNIYKNKNHIQTKIKLWMAFNIDFLSFQCI